MDIVLPKIPEHIPPPGNAKAALALLEELMPDAEEIIIIQNEHVQYLTAVRIWETITCPRCSADIDFDWWGETMSSDHDEETGFRLDAYSMPCCSKPVALNELIYEVSSGFRSHCLSAMNPNVGKVSDNAVRKIEAALGCDISVVYQHF